jgi:S-methylmethionine-dependent homocysteine/selenocysteine methylase
MQTFLKTHRLILMEAAIIEQLRRDERVVLHPRLENAFLIYQKHGEEALAKLYQSYIDIAQCADLPILLCTPTWRANYERVQESQVALNINGDAVQFLQKCREHQHPTTPEIKIGGLIGCKNDCYKPNEALSSDKAEKFHAWQINQLAHAGVDFLMAVTLPSVEEALGIAKAMEKTKVPYILSFVIGRDSCILDGTSLLNAISAIDESTKYPPIGYLVNCAYPSFLCASKQPKALYKRLIGYQANASSLDHCDLDGAADLEVNDISDWGEQMITLNQTYGIKILGGCCGTGVQHLKYIVNHGI